MSSVNHEPVYESPSGYGENKTQKQIKLDSRQTNISKIAKRKAKVSADNANISYHWSGNKFTATIF